MSTVLEWSRAFAAQAASDLAARDALLKSSLHACHQLHYLQMACEKLCKSYLLSRGSDVDALQMSHAYIAKTLPQIAREQFRSHRSLDWLTDQIKPPGRGDRIARPRRHRRRSSP